MNEFVLNLKEKKPLFNCPEVLILLCFYPFVYICLVQIEHCHILFCDCLIVKMIPSFI